MIIGAADTSGNWNFISILIGNEQDICQTYSKLGYSGIHMRMLPKPIKEKVIKRFEVTNDIFCMSINVNKSSIIRKFEIRMRRNKRESIKKYVEQQYNYVLFNEIDKICRDFLTKHNVSISEIIFEIDNDLRTFFSSNGLKFSNPSMAHEITDIIAYCNSTSRDLKRVSEKDVSDKVELALVKRLRL